MSEPLIPLPPQGPSFEERDVPICPTCSGLVRRNATFDIVVGEKFGPWRCDRHGEVTPVWERFEIPTGYDDES